MATTGLSMGIATKVAHFWMPMLAHFCMPIDRRVRDKCLNESLFSNLAEAQRITNKWRYHYNNERPHSAFNWKTPNEFAKSCSELTQNMIDKAAWACHLWKHQLLIGSKLRGRSNKPVLLDNWERNIERLFKGCLYRTKRITGLMKKTTIIVDD